jgi:hypothetical protein
MASIACVFLKLETKKVEQDLAEGVAGAVPVPPDEAGKDEVIDALVANVEAMIKADRKITSLKQLQVFTDVAAIILVKFLLISKQPLHSTQIKFHETILFINLI